MPALAPTEDPFGSDLRTKRLNRGWSQDELAKRVGSTQPAVSNWEDGTWRPRRDVMARLNELLDADYALWAEPVPGDKNAGLFIMSTTWPLAA